MSSSAARASSRCSRGPRASCWSDAISLARCTLQPKRSIFVNNLDYNAKGQRERVEYGNGVVTEYRYDEETFRLIAIRSTRGAVALQDMQYELDPVGNIVQLTDGVAYGNTAVSADGLYEYD